MVFSRRLRFFQDITPIQFIYRGNEDLLISIELGAGSLNEDLIALRGEDFPIE